VLDPIAIGGRPPQKVLCFAAKMTI